MNYNYVIFDDNTDVFYKTTLQDLFGKENIKVYCPLLNDRPKIVQNLFRVHISEKTMRYVVLPLKSIWNKHIFSSSFIDDKPICFVFANSTYKLRWCGYFDYLKQNFPGCKLVYYCRDLFDYYKDRYRGFDEEYLKRTFDAILTYDMLDVINHNLVFYPDFESMVSSDFNQKHENNKVLFIGQARDRLKLILDVYHRLTDNGIPCDFYLTGVDEKLRFEGPGIVFADKWMPYTEVVDKTIKAGCILEIVQENTVGYSARAMKAIGYNKRLITNSIAVKYTRFYDDKNIQYFSNANDIDVMALKEKHYPDYHYNNEFSPLRMLDFLDKYFTEKITDEEYYGNWFDLKTYKNELLNNKNLWRNKK